MDNTKKTSISPAPDGPYIVKNLNRLSNKNGTIDTEVTMAFCRCGKSANKPYCDGAHAASGFSSKNTKPLIENKLDTYTGKKISIHDNRSLCAHAGVCTDNLSAVFRIKQEPWIEPNAADVESIIKTIKNCPSGALNYTVEEPSTEITQGTAEVFIAANGPYVVTGCPQLLNCTWPEGASNQQYTLCRCGASKNKPFCDGSHWEIDFRDDDN